jgi:hypothetical protein
LPHRLKKFKSVLNLKVFNYRKRENKKTEK